MRSKIRKRYALLKPKFLTEFQHFTLRHAQKVPAATIHSILADFPTQRIANQAPPFTNTGSSHSGPFYVIVGHCNENIWGFLFSCLTTRAVHVEVVYSMDTGSSFLAIQWFVSRKDTPAMIWSDNGRNFKGARKSSLNMSENGVRSTLPLNLHRGLLGGGSIRPVCIKKLASRRGRYLAWREYCIQSSAPVASQMRSWATFPFVEYAVHVRPQALNRPTYAQNHPIIFYLVTRQPEYRH